MVDSGDMAMLGVIGGAAAGYKFSDGKMVGAALGAGAGMVLAGESGERVLEQAVKK